MIYISIDNDYHFEQASSLVNKLNLRREQVKIISHHSPRNNNVKEADFEVILVKGHPLSDGMSFRKLASHLKSHLHILDLNQVIDFKGNDILIIFTEYQLNNAVLAKKMKMAGGKVYLFDEGIGFYFNNSTHHKKSLSFKKLIFKFILYFHGIPVLPKNAHEGVIFSIKDVLIDKIYLRALIPINRNVPIEISPLSDVRRSRLSSEHETAAFFVATNFDCFGLKKEEMELARKVINHLTKVFSKVYIKIHPSDYFSKNDVYDFYLSFNSKNLQVVDNSINAIKVIELYNPRVVVGSMSTVLFDAISEGAEAIFTYHLLPYVENFGVYTHTLVSLSYNFVKSIDEITPEYKSGIDKHNLFGKSSSAIDLMEDFRWQE